MRRATNTTVVLLALVAALAIACDEAPPATIDSAEFHEVGVVGSNVLSGPNYRIEFSAARTSRGGRWVHVAAVPYLDGATRKVTLSPKDARSFSRAGADMIKRARAAAAATERVASQFEATARSARVGLTVTKDRDELPIPFIDFGDGRGIIPVHRPQAEDFFALFGQAADRAAGLK